MDKYESLKLENQMCFPLYAASKEVIKQYRPFLDAVDLTYTQYIAMMVLWEEKHICVKDLGAKLYLDSGTLTPVLKSLEKKGFVKRERCVEDERMLYADVTEEGMRLRKQALEIPKQLAACVRLDPGDAEKLSELLYKLLGKLTDKGENDG